MSTTRDLLQFQRYDLEVQHIPQGTARGRVGVVVRALAFHQCGPGSISALGVKCGLSLLALYSAIRDFSPGTPVFPLTDNQHLILFVENNNFK